MQEKYPATIESDSMDAEGALGEYEYEEGLEDEELEEGAIDIETLLKSDNIASILTEEELLKIANTVLEGYELDKDSRCHREPAMDAAMNMALHITKPKNTPWKNASNVIFPLISNASISFAARAYPAIVRNDEVVTTKVLGDDRGKSTPVLNPQGQPQIDPNTGQPATQMIGAGLKKARAERVKTYMNFQFMEEMEEWEEDTDKLLNALPVTGSMFRKVYWCEEEERNKSHLVYPKYLIVNDKVSSIDRAPRVSEEIEYYPYEIAEFIRADIWLDFDFTKDSSVEKDESSEREQDSFNSADKDKQQLFIEQLCRFDFDNDGYPEPYIVTVHKGLKRVVRIKADYKEDRIKKNSRGEIRRIVPETYFIKYPFIPAPDGSFYDLGFGELLLHCNETINSLINQLVDAGSLATTSSGFIGRGLRIKGGDIKVKKGEYVPVDTKGGPIKDNFVQIQHPEPSATLFQLLGLLIEVGKDLGSLKDVLSGEQMANQSATTTLTLIEQGLTAFKAVYKRVSRAVKKEIAALYRLNYLYLNDDVYSNMINTGLEISRQDFTGKDCSVIPASAPSMVSDMQRLARASFMEGYKDDPYVNGLELRTRVFEIAGIDNLDTLLKMPDPPPPDANMEMVKVQQQLGMAQMQIEQDKNKIKELEVQLAHQIDEAKTQVEAVKAQSTANVQTATIHKIQAETNNLDAKSIQALATAESLSKQTFENHKAEVEELSGNQTN